MDTQLLPASPPLSPFQTGGSARGPGVPTPSTPIPGGNARQVPKLEAIAAFMLLNPTAGQKEIAREFGVSVSWLWSVTRTDGFRTLISARAEEVYSHALRSVREKMERVADLALERLEERLEVGGIETELVLDVGKAMLDRIGHGGKKTLEVQGELTHTVRPGIITDTRAALLQKNRTARLRALGLLSTDSEHLGEVIENGAPDELSSGGADRARAEGVVSPQLSSPQETSRSASEGVGV